MGKNKLEAYWNLGNLLYQKKILKVTEFHELLLRHGVKLSYGQAYALVHEQPLRVTLRVVSAICEALDCSVNDLVVLRKVSEKELEETPEKKPRTAELKRIPKKLIGKRLEFD